MGYTTVVAGTAITASWGNTEVRDQVVTPFATAAARTAAVAAPVEGMMSWLSDYDDVWAYNGAAYKPIAGPPIAYKTADEIVNNSAALQNDDHLLVAVAASAYYAGEVYLGYTSAVAAGMQVDFTAPAGATLRCSSYLASGVATPFGPTNALGAVGGLPGTAAQLPYLGRFMLTTTNAGTLQFRWAQAVANASNTTVHQGSWLALRRVA
jgi:hypothetical protein